MRPCDRLLQAVTMRATRGVKRFLLIGVASLLHAKAIGTPLTHAMYICDMSCALFSFRPPFFFEG